MLIVNGKKVGEGPHRENDGGALLTGRRDRGHRHGRLLTGDEGLRPMGQRVHGHDQDGDREAEGLSVRRRSYECPSGAGTPNRMTRAEDFQSSCRTETMCHHRSLLVSIQAFNAGALTFILPIRTHRGI